MLTALLLTAALQDCFVNTEPSQDYLEAVAVAELENIYHRAPLATLDVYVFQGGALSMSFHPDAVEKTKLELYETMAFITWEDAEHWQRLVETGVWPGVERADMDAPLIIERKRWNNSNEFKEMVELGALPGIVPLDAAGPSSEEAGGGDKTGWKHSKVSGWKFKCPPSGTTLTSCSNSPGKATLCVGGTGYLVPKPATLTGTCSAPVNDGPLACMTSSCSVQGGCAIVYAGGTGSLSCEE